MNDDDRPLDARILALLEEYCPEYSEEDRVKLAGAIMDETRKGGISKGELDSWVRRAQGTATREVGPTGLVGRIDVMRAFLVAWASDDRPAYVKGPPAWAYLLEMVGYFVGHARHGTRLKAFERDMDVDDIKGEMVPSLMYGVRTAATHHGYYVHRETTPKQEATGGSPGKEGDP